MKVVIAGSRFYFNYQQAVRCIEGLNLQIDTVVCGMCDGADTLGYNWAKNNKIEVIERPALWTKYKGKSAAAIRNREMAQIADCGILFFKRGEKNKGTRMMLGFLEELNKPAYLFHV